MNKKLLCAALLAGLGVAQAASAQEFDDRWYVTGSVGMNMQDNDRGTRNAPFGAIGMGKFVNPNWSFDVELNYQKPVFDTRAVCVNPTIGACNSQDLNWSQYGISFDARRHFISAGRNWNPYMLMGLGFQREEIQTDNYPSAASPTREKTGGLAAKLGLGLQGDLGRVGIRTELAYRAAAINDTRAALLMDAPGTAEQNDGEDWYGDVLASVGIVIPLGPEPVAPVAPAPVVVDDCSSKDSDGDGVNNCVDKCPDSQPGQTIGPDGCPVPVTIDLKGVEFNFDYPKPNWNGQLNTAGLVPGSIQILDNAVNVLKGSAIRVEVAGHTDLCGADGYNQSLSERRARVVYNYLTNNGVDAGRLMGPNGYGESRPLVNTPQTKPECVNQTNRRTELNVQN